LCQLARNGYLSRAFQTDEMPTEMTNYLKRNIKQLEFKVHCLSKYSNLNVTLFWPIFDYFFFVM
ncbi:hypothetical protein OFM39_35310, partial [Escherichia coli]|nr:hypothetical protein [Escherichia coli]